MARRIQRNMGNLLALWCFILVFGSYNPSGYSFYHLVTTANWALAWPLLIPATLLFVFAWIAFFYVSKRAINPFVFGIFVLATTWVCVFLPIYYRIVDYSGSAMTWLILLCLSLVMSIAINASRIRFYLFAQRDVGVIDDGYGEEH